MYHRYLFVAELFLPAKGGLQFDLMKYSNVVEVKKYISQLCVPKGIVMNRSEKRRYCY